MEGLGEQCQRPGPFSSSPTLRLMATSSLLRASLWKLPRIRRQYTSVFSCGQAILLLALTVAAGPADRPVVELTVQGPPGAAPRPCATRSVKNLAWDSTSKVCRPMAQKKQKRPKGHLPISIHTYIHTYLPTYLPTYVRTYTLRVHEEASGRGSESPRQALSPSALGHIWPQERLRAQCKKKILGTHAPTNRDPSIYELIAF